MTHLNLTENNLLIQAQTDYSDNPYPSVEEPEWEEIAELSNQEYAASLQEAEGIALHEKAF